jgi:hypothetical protein
MATWVAEDFAIGGSGSSGHLSSHFSARGVSAARQLQIHHNASLHKMKQMSVDGSGNSREL